MAPVAVGLKHGFRSGLEETLAAHLGRLGVSYEFEKRKVEYVQPAKDRVYTPDFWLPRLSDITLPREVQRGFYVETKGRWLTEDRQKHKHIRDSNPSLDIRFVFSNANQRISKQSATTYAIYCERNKWLWAHRALPVDWLRELGYQIPVYEGIK